MAHRARQRRGQVMRMPGQEDAGPAQQAARRHGRVEKFGPVPHAGAQGNVESRISKSETISSGKSQAAGKSQVARSGCGLDISVGVVKLVDQNGPLRG